MKAGKLTLLYGQRSGDLMLDRNVVQSDVSTHPHRISYAGTLPRQLQPADVLEELQDLLEEYAPTWYTQERRERVHAALRSRKKS